jgi:hypothetical protein
MHRFGGDPATRPASAARREAFAALVGKGCAVILLIATAGVAAAIVGAVRIGR